MRLLIHDYAGHAFPVQLSRQFAKRGHSVIHAFASGLMTPRGRLQKGRNDPASFGIHEIRMDSGYRGDKYRFFRRRNMEVAYGGELSGLIAELRPDVVLSGNTPTEPQFRLLRECERRGIPFVSWIQDFYGIAVDRLARRKLPVVGAIAGAWYRNLERKTLARSTGVVSITEDFLPALQDYGVNPKRIRVIPNWAPLTDLPIMPRRNEWALKHGLADSFCFLYAGTLAMKHNPELLWQLASRFRSHPEVRVVVISEGPGSDWLAAKIRIERVTNLVVLPYQDFDQMSQVLASGDVLVAILENDASAFSVPSKVLTYLCGGNPVLAAIPAKNLAARTIRTAGAGICVEPENSEAFVIAARNLYQNSRLRKDYGTRGRTYAEEHFDIDRIFNRFEGFLSDVVGQGERVEEQMTSGSIANEMKGAGTQHQPSQIL